MGFLASRERGTLDAVCETLVPSLAPEVGTSGSLYSLTAAEVELSHRVEEALQGITDAGQRFQLRLFLKLLAHPAANGLLAGLWLPFDHGSLADREAILRSWMESRFGMRRQAFQAIKRLALFLQYTVEGKQEDHPLWPLIGYPTPSKSESTAPRLETLEVKAGEDLTAEVVVVGSGAGGGVIAAKLAAAGKDVLVIEKGGNHGAGDFHGQELQANIDMFEQQGALTTSDLAIVVLAGSTLGGGTVVNWSTSLPTPDEVRFQWERVFGFEGACSPEYERSLQSVADRLQLNTDESVPNPQNRVLERGGEALGNSVKVITRNVRDCVDCTFCTFGCRFEAKRSSLTTYLRDARMSGARVIVGTQVDRILVDRGLASGVKIRGRTEAGSVAGTVRSKAVVVCAGAVHTPALLERSGLRNRNIGHHLRLHPVTAPVGWFREPIRSWQGPPQTRMIDDLADLDGYGYGVRLEVAPAHPGLWASSLAWTSGRAHRRLMSELDHLANIIVISRDSGSGTVSTDRNGRPQLQYRLSPRDRRHLIEGLLHAIRIQHAAGAMRILSPHASPEVFDAGKGKLPAYLDRVKSRGLPPNGSVLFSAHQMGTARIAGSQAQGVTRPDGATWEVGNVFVADGSVFPTACGVNPMVPIMATADFLAERILAQL
jgi:choline dehydrogenase-like flavoprotein